MPRREPQSIRNGDAVNLTPLLLSKEGKAWIVNYAMNEWGESTLWELVDRSIAARGKRPERLKIETQSRSACYTHGVK